MKNPFVQATKQQKKLKVLLYGASGAGKTRAALTFPRPAVIDTENGTDLYAGRAGVPEFAVLRAKSMTDVENAVQFIREDGGKSFDTLVIDSLTVLYDVQKEAAAKTGKDGEMNPRLWNRVNGRMVALYNSLINLPVHVVVIAREAEMYEGEGLNLKRTGVKPDGDKKMSYLFDFVVRMKADHSGDIVKSRGVNLSTAMPVVNWQAFEKAAGLFADGSAAVVMSDETAVSQDANAYLDEASEPVTLSRMLRSPNQQAKHDAEIAQAPAPQAPIVMLSLTDKDKWKAFLKWCGDKFQMSEPAVMSILKPVIINDELPRTTAMARVLACSAGYDASEIRSLGLEKKLTDDVIAEAVYIPMPEIPF